MGRSPAARGVARIPVRLSEADDTPPEPPAAGAGSTAHRRGVRSWWLVALLVALVVGVVVDGIGERRETRRLAALAEVPGTAPPLDRPLRERWRVDGVLQGRLDDLLLVGGTGIEGGVRALDARTGRAVWARAGAPGGVEWCRPGPAGPAGPSARPMAVCVGPSAASGDPPDRPGALVSAVDGASGGTVAALTLEHQVLDLRAVDDGVVVVTGEPDGRVGMLRWDVAADEVLWRMSSFDRVVRDEPPEIEWFRHVASVRAARWIAVDLRSGHEVPAYYVDDLRWLDLRRHDLPDGAWVEWTDASDDAVVAPVTRVREAAGPVRYAVPGRPWFAAVDDGSAADVLLVATVDSRTTVRALRTDTGERVWSRRLPRTARPAFLVGQVLVAAGRGTTVAVDTRTGEVRWTRVGPADVAPVTDGRFVLLEHDRDGATVLAAHRLDDGMTAWAGRAPAGTVEVTTVPGAVLAVGDGWLAGLR